MAHSLSEQGNKFATWENQLSSSVKANLNNSANYYVREALRSFNKKVVVDNNGNSNMSKLLSKLLSDDAAIKYLLSRVSFLHVVVETKFVSIDELIQAIDAVPDTSERKPLYLINRADIMMKQKKNFPAADKDYSRARELAASLKQSHLLEIANAHQARTYFDNNRKAEAEKLAATVDVTKLSEQDMKMFAPLAKFAKPAPPQNPPTTKEAP
jgi:hypothetical protein